VAANRGYAFVSADGLLVPQQQKAIMPTEYTAQIRRLRLPEQDDLKNESERCSADPAMLESIGRSIGQQIRVVRKDDPRFAALYTVKNANPEADSGLAEVVRTGQTGRERLGTDAEMEATVQANVVDAPPQSGESVGVRFFEMANDDGKQAYFVAIAPHGGDIERHTDEEAREAFRLLTTAGFPAALWLCERYGDQAKGAFDRWHITSNDLQPACFPLLERVASRTFCYALAFHGFQRREGEADVYIGGGASRPVKRAIERALNDLALPIRVKISTRHDDAKFQGFSADNILNRLATSGIQLEQSLEAREFRAQIACAVADVFASDLRFLIFVQNLKDKRIDAEAQLARAHSKDLAAGPLNVESAISKHKAWRATDDALAAKIQAAEKVRTFIEAMNSPYIWPLSKSSTPDEMDTSFGPRINADKWDFHDGIDLPAPIGTPVYAMRAGRIFRAGPGEPDKNVKGFHSRHVLIEVEDISDQKVYLVYLHLDSIASGITIGANVSQGQLIGTVGKDHASHSHLHCEFRKGSSNESASVHPLNYLPYTGTLGVSGPVLNRCNRSGSTIAVQITFEAYSKLQGDLLGAEVNLLENGQSLEASPRKVNFDDKTTIHEGNDDDLRFNDRDIAVEGYQKSDMVKDGRPNLHYGILVRNVPLNCDSLVTTLLNVSGASVADATLQIPSKNFVDDTVDFEGGVFPPQGWITVSSTSSAGTSVSVVSSAAHSGSRGMRCVDASTTETTAQRAGIERPLPPGRFEWRAQAWFNPEALTLKRSQSVLLFRFTDGEHLIAAAHINKERVLGRNQREETGWHSEVQKQQS
jgi:murein DD-endopeptidase MepM/ murein hydrolase activator NlpD